MITCMAKKTILVEEFTDDLDGSKALGTTYFSYDGVDYEIDLSKKNKNAFDKALKLYVDAARAVKPRGKRPQRTAASSTKRKGDKRRDLAAVREWAKSQGMPVADRGRISAEILSAYDAK